MSRSSGRPIYCLCRCAGLVNERIEGAHGRHPGMGWRRVLPGKLCGCSHARKILKLEGAKPAE